MKNMGRLIPSYVASAVPVPQANRVPWYKSTFPAYAGIFLWVGFYLQLSGPSLLHAGVGVSLLGVLVAGLLCFALFYYAPAMLGMKTGHSLYIVGTSTFGVTGGYLIPGLLMGILQVGWVGVQGSVSATFLMKGLNLTSRSVFAILVTIWVYGLGWVAVKGIHYVGKVAKFLNWVPLFMIVAVFWANRSGVPHYHPPQPDAPTGFLNALAVVIGFFATAGAAGADFGMNNRNRKDVVWGGLWGIAGGCFVAGGLAVLSVAGYLGRGVGPVSYDYTYAIASVGSLAPVMFLLFAAASMVPTCFSSFIASNSFSTMLPRIPRAVSTFAALSVSILLAITGVASNLVGFFNLVGASFGSVCGAMLAEYLAMRGNWAGPRRGINWAGCIAWACGFLVGIPQYLPGLPASWVRADNPAGLYSLLVGFAMYLVLTKAGARSGTVEIERESTCTSSSSTAAPAR